MNEKKEILSGNQEVSFKKINGSISFEMI